MSTRPVAIPMLCALVLVVAALAGCPDRREAIDRVGGAPKAQLDEVKARVGKAEDKLQKNADAAAAAADTN